MTANPISAGHTSASDAGHLLLASGFLSPTTVTLNGTATNDVFASSAADAFVSSSPVRRYAALWAARQNAAFATVRESRCERVVVTAGYNQAVVPYPLYNDVWACDAPCTSVRA